MRHVAAEAKNVHAHLERGYLLVPVVRGSARVGPCDAVMTMTVRTQYYYGGGRRLPGTVPSMLPRRILQSSTTFGEIYSRFRCNTRTVQNLPGYRYNQVPGIIPALLPGRYKKVQS